MDLSILMHQKVKRVATDGQDSGPNASMDTITQINTGNNHTCGLKTDGTLEYWGSLVKAGASTCATLLR